MATQNLVAKNKVDRHSRVDFAYSNRSEQKSNSKKNSASIGGERSSDPSRLSLRRFVLIACLPCTFKKVIM